MLIQIGSMIEVIKTKKRQCDTDATPWGHCMRKKGLTDMTDSLIFNLTKSRLLLQCVNVPIFITEIVKFHPFIPVIRNRISNMI